MSIRVYIWGILISTIAALAAWIFVIFYINPDEAGIIGKIFFYASFFLFLAGSSVIFLIWLRGKFLGEDVAVETIGLSFRQGVLLASFPVIIVALLGLGYLVWWNGLLILAGIFLAELYFLSKDK